jgi:ABC-type lipoprotein export system ATPase subunit
MADEDTNTKRKILVNNEKISREIRYSTNKKLVAQLSQNMNFVVDLTVREFVLLHAESRLIENTNEVIDKIIEKANELAGESFDSDAPITSLSGGQSRALMIADTAILSKSPIVLIDEIENAGIDRQRALKLLIKNDKIVIMATHDPILALMADKRIVIKNGAIHNILKTSEKERESLDSLFKLDSIITKLRTQIRNGETMEQNLEINAI